MSNISDALDEIRAVVIATLPNHVEMINPYVPELNDDLTMESSWGIRAADGLNTNLQLACRMSIDRSVSIHLTRKIFSGQLMRGAEAVVIRRDAEKNLLEDQYLVVKALEQSPTITDSGVITKFVFQSDSGPQFVRTERSDMLILTSVFTLSYFENL